MLPPRLNQARNLSCQPQHVVNVGQLREVFEAIGGRRASAGVVPLLSGRATSHMSETRNLLLAVTPTIFPTFLHIDVRPQRTSPTHDGEISAQPRPPNPAKGQQGVRAAEVQSLALASVKTKPWQVLEARGAAKEIQDPNANMCNIMVEDLLGIERAEMRPKGRHSPVTDHKQPPSLACLSRTFKTERLTHVQDGT